MLDLLIFLVTVLGVWKTAQYVSGFVEEQWLLEPQRSELQKKFEAWWTSIYMMRPRYFAVALARAVSDALTSFFGKRLFSKRAFVRSTAIGTCLLLLSIALTSAFGKTLKPWKEFEHTMEAIKEAPYRMPARPPSTNDVVDAEAATLLKEIGERYGTVQWKLIYCATFFFVLIASNALSFFLAIGFSRLVLQEIVASGRMFSACSLLALNLFLVISIASLFLMFITVLAYPALWFVVPLGYFLSQSSIYWVLAMVFGGGIAVWAFGNPFLQIVSMIAILPCLGTLLVCVLSVVALLSRKRFHELCCAILLRCTSKKPFSFIVGFLGLIAVVIALTIRAVQKFL